MDLAVVQSRASEGIDAPPVRVEVALGPGLPGVELIGTHSTVGRQARERVKAALRASGFDMPVRKITVNLAPAELPKEGGRFDLPIAVGILAANGDLPRPALRARMLIGELALTGELLPTRGILPAALAARAAGLEAIVPAADAGTLRHWAEGVVCARTLAEAVAYLRGRKQLPSPAQIAPIDDLIADDIDDFADVRGQDEAKWALTVTAAGGHHALLLGPPGCGKTMLARRFTGLLPPLEHAAAEQARVIASIANLPAPVSARPPIRMPHHSTKPGALIGGGTQAWPGEITLAHRGVLFMDELAEWPREVLDLLRQPLQDRQITLLRGRRAITYPAAFQLIAASNPCPCGKPPPTEGDTKGKCRCSIEKIRRYQQRLSGPFVDRLDIQVHLHPVTADDLSATRSERLSPGLRDTILVARQIQMERQGMLNAELPGESLEGICGLRPVEWRRLMTCAETNGLSARGVHRTLKVARTVADLEAAGGGGGNVSWSHLMQAMAWAPTGAEPH